MAAKTRDKIGRAVSSLTIGDGRKVVSSAGSEVALESSKNVVNFVVITAETDNTGVITVGASTVVASLSTRRGIPLSAGDTISLGGVDLNEVYLDATVSGDGVTYLYIK